MQRVESRYPFLHDGKKAERAGEKIDALLNGHVLNYIYI